MDMDLTEDDMRRLPEADRRGSIPPIAVEMATLTGERGHRTGSR